MKRLLLIVLSVFIFQHCGLGQIKQTTEDSRILIRGMVIDANTLAPITNSQILINNTFSSVSGPDGSFSFYVNRHDTVEFRSLGYKQTILPVSDTLMGMEYLTGIYLNTDTLTIPEVIIIPGYSNLKSEIMNARSETPAAIENARYNVAVSAYQGKNSQNVLGTPQNNYAVISQRQKINAFEKGGIPSEHIVGFNPLIFLPAAYMLLHGLPESPPPYKPKLTDQEVEQVNQKYLETHYERK
jgi:hypothetical protein